LDIILLVAISIVPVIYNGGSETYSIYDTKTSRVGDSPDRIMSCTGEYGHLTIKVKIFN
ncbi:23674_t:CDS:1, partial [Gigaspora rosea]